MKKWGFLKETVITVIVITVICLSFSIYRTMLYKTKLAAFPARKLRVIFFNQNRLLFKGFLHLTAKRFLVFSKKITNFAA